MERSPDWLLDEVASAGRENLDPEHVARVRAALDELAGLVKVRCHDHGADVGVSAAS